MKQRKGDAKQRDCKTTRLRSNERAMRNYGRAKRKSEILNSESARWPYPDTIRTGYIDFKHWFSSLCLWGGAVTNRGYDSLRAILVQQPVFVGWSCHKSSSCNIIAKPKPGIKNDIAGMSIWTSCN